MSDTSGSPVGGRLTYVDGLRALAAMAVFLVHATGILNVAAVGHPGGVAEALIRASGYGPLGVDVFFVISGFVIAYSIRDDRVTLGYAGRFAVRRSLRLDPPYWCAIAIGTLWVVARHRLGSAAEPLPTLAQVLTHLAYLQGVLGQRHIVVVFWTLCLEVQLYLAFIVLLLLSRWIPRRSRFDPGCAGATATLCAFGLSLAWPAGLVGGVASPGPRPGGAVDHLAAFPAYFPSSAFKFLAGATVAYAFLGYLRPAMAGGAMVLLAAVLAARAARYGSADVLPGTAVLVTATSLLVASQVGGLRGWLSWRPLLFLGSMSYSIYLLHVPMIGLMMAVQKRSGWTSLPTAIGFLGLAFLFTVAGGFGLYRLVERPSMRMAHHLKRSRM